MKTLLLLALLIWSSLFVYAQQGLDFFPHAVGNTWYYETTPGQPRRVGTFVKDSIDAKDSTILYVFWGETSIAYMLDLKNSDVYSGLKNRLLYRFDVPAGTGYIVKAYPDLGVKAYRVYSSEGGGQMFGRSVKVRKFVEFSQDDVGGHKTDPIEYYVASGIGYTGYYFDVTGATEYLTGCIINGDTLGDIRPSSTTDVEEQTEQAAAMAFPNPAQDVVFINSGSMSSLGASIRVLSMQGEELSLPVQRITTDVYSMDIRSLEQGAYTALVSVGRQYKTVRFVVMR